MEFRLIKTQTPTSCYGSIPDVDDQNDIEVHQFDAQDMDLMLDDFRFKVNSICGTLLDVGDIDFIPADKCPDLIAWIEEQEDTCTPRIRGHYDILKQFAQQAVELQTGVVVEL